ncbi:chemotaxis protein CheW [Desulfonatronum thioautotrophicum]|nr:chemotaxis protein CheW [Desulfonatronum thioautotrophicum]
MNIPHPDNRFHAPAWERSESPGVSGCTILGDGKVSLILDVAGLVAERGT